MLLTGFALAPTWWRGAAWRRRDSGIESLFDPAALVPAVRAAESAGFDFAFRPDRLAIDPAAAARDCAGLGADPMIQAAVLGAATSRIELVVTVSAVFADPYPLARQLASLEQLTGGRIGWNLVTSLDGDGNFATERPASSAERWSRAAELLEVVETLRASFPLEAFRPDRETGELLDPARLRPIEHSGTHFRVLGPLPMPAGPRERLPLLQAGGTPEAVAFAARHADRVFAVSPDLDEAIAFRSRIRELAETAGRDPESIRVLSGLSLVLAEDRAAAARLHAESAADSPDRGARHWTVIGTPDDAVAEILARADAGAIDGFIAFPGGSWASAELLCSEVMPALRAHGLLGI